MDYESAPVDVNPLTSDLKDEVYAHSVIVADADADGREPTEEEFATLRKVSAGMPWPVRAHPMLRGVPPNHTSSRQLLCAS